MASQEGLQDVSPGEVTREVCKHRRSFLCPHSPRPSPPALSAWHASYFPNSSCAQLNSKSNTLKKTVVLKQCLRFPRYFIPIFLPPNTLGSDGGGGELVQVVSLRPGHRGCVSDFPWRSGFRGRIYRQRTFRADPVRC